MTTDDKRLIEDYLPIQAISKEASREKSLRKGNISTLHLWWARRPLVACRAAVYASLVPATQFQPGNGPEEKRASLGRAHARRFVEALCKYPGSPRYIEQAQQHILAAHAERLTKETGETVTAEDIREGRAPRPKILDMFAGGGAIPLEALRLGCDAYALDLNPVAHIIELCTLVYPQKYGEPDPNAYGMTGQKNSMGEATWGGLADEVRFWGKWVLDKVQKEIGDLYPPIPDPKAPKSKTIVGKPQMELAGTGFDEHPGQQDLSYNVPEGFLTPIAYLWTRTVNCKNPACGATVPLVKQTWLCKKKDRYVALKIVAPKGEKQVRFEIVEASFEKKLGFDPSVGSKAGSATCPFCGTVVDSDYVKVEGRSNRIGQQLMAMVGTRPRGRGRVYVAANDQPSHAPDKTSILNRIEELCERTGLSVPDEPIINDAKSALFCILYGLMSWGDLFTPRQMLSLLTFSMAIREGFKEMTALGLEAERAKAITTYLAIYLDRGADHWSSLCAWNAVGEKLQHTYGRQALPMIWDFSEGNPFGGSVGDWMAIIKNAENGIWAGVSSGAVAANVDRGSAMALPCLDNSFDAVLTDPPYYDNVPYADISDFFYVWLKRSIGELYPAHFATVGTPKKSEAVADAVRHDGDRGKARDAYEQMIYQSFKEGHRVLKQQGHLVIVYAHKTTLGWSTLVDALRMAGFSVTEAWPLDTEMRTRLRGMESAALASSIFLVARKREGNAIGSYEEDVQSELGAIVRERVSTLWKMGITGADLVIAAVGAGLRAFTKYSKVEYANGEEVPAEKFLAEVEGVVLETLLEKIFGVVGTGVSSIDGPSRFYVLWRFAYKATEMDAGEAIVFTYGQNVELDGHRGLSNGRHALVDKKKSKYRLRDFKDRGADDKLGLPGDDMIPVPLIDALHRILWLVENQPRRLNEYLDQAQPDRERIRLLAQTIAGTALEGKPGNGGQHSVTTTAAEQSALNKLLSNWRALMGEGGLFNKVNER